MQSFLCFRHCEERSDEAIQSFDALWIASLSAKFAIANFVAGSQ
jgi:hypothetical protein